jgi:isoleucyl-tRNA synthetase
VRVYTLSPDDLLILESVDMAEIAIVSSVGVTHVHEMPQGTRTDEHISVGVSVGLAAGSKCERCWKISEEVTLHSTEQYGDVHLCQRCFSIISES